MPFPVKVSIRISRKKRDKQDEWKAGEVLHCLGNASLRIQILGVNGFAERGPFQTFKSFKRCAPFKTLKIAITLRSLLDIAPSNYGSQTFYSANLAQFLVMFISGECMGRRPSFCLPEFCITWSCAGNVDRRTFLNESNYQAYLERLGRSLVVNTKAKVYLFATLNGWRTPSSYSSKNFSFHFLEKNCFTALPRWSKETLRRWWPQAEFPSIQTLDTNIKQHDWQSVASELHSPRSDPRSPARTFLLTLTGSS